MPLPPCPDSAVHCIAFQGGGRIQHFLAGRVSGVNRRFRGRVIFTFVIWHIRRLLGLFVNRFTRTAIKFIKFHFASHRCSIFDFGRPLSTHPPEVFELECESRKAPVVLCRAAVHSLGSALALAAGGVVSLRHFDQIRPVRVFTCQSSETRPLSTALHPAAISFFLFDPRMRAAGPH